MFVWIIPWPCFRAIYTCTHKDLKILSTDYADYSEVFHCVFLHYSENYLRQSPGRPAEQCGIRCSKGQRPLESPKEQPDPDALEYPPTSCVATAEKVN